MLSFYRILAIFYTVCIMTSACLATSSAEQNDLRFDNSKPLQRRGRSHLLDNAVSPVQSDFGEESENDVLSAEYTDNLARYKDAVSPSRRDELSERSCTKDVDRIGRACRCDHECNYYGDNNLWCYLRDQPEGETDAYGWCCRGSCFKRCHWLYRTCEGSNYGWKCRGGAYVFVYEYRSCNAAGSKGAHRE